MTLFVILGSFRCLYEGSLFQRQVQWATWPVLTDNIHKETLLNDKLSIGYWSKQIKNKHIAE